MWLLPHLPRVAAILARGYYALRIDGTVPRSGPVLLVANHPNSLLDPVLVAAAAGRPLRFLAKAPLFTHPVVGWLVRGAGCIPVHRRQDDPSRMGDNAVSLAAAEAELARGAAVALFPEGVSHSEPHLAPLKTGAARLALGAARSLGQPVPIIPVGLVLRERERFRSEALVVVGHPVGWADLLDARAPEAEPVRALTARMEEALRGVTVNLDRWEDRPLVLGAHAIYAAQAGDDRGGQSAGTEVSQAALAAHMLATARERADPELPVLARDVRRHLRLLETIGLSPADLERDTSIRTALRWSVARLSLGRGVLSVIAAAGTALLYVPYRLTLPLARLSGPEPDVLATTKVLVGMALLAVWSALAGVAAALLLQRWWGVALGLLVPPVALLTLWVHERWRHDWRDARRYLRLRGIGERKDELRREQRALAQRLTRFAARYAKERDLV